MFIGKNPTTSKYIYWEMNKFSLFKFTVYAPIFILILEWPTSENSPRFMLHGIFALVASIAFGYFFYLFYTNAEELIFTHNGQFENLINRSF